MKLPLKKEDKNLTLSKMTNKSDDGTTINFNTDEPNFNDEIGMKAVAELLNIDKLKTISRIKPDQVSNLTKLYLFSQTFNAPFTKDLADNILQLQISLNGYGRRELVQLVGQRNNTFIEKPITSKDIFK